MIQRKLILVFAFFCINVTSIFAQSTVKISAATSERSRSEAISNSPKGTLVTEKLASTILRDNRIGLDPNRSIYIYLPPGYHKSGKSYPVVYYLHNINWSPEQIFRDSNMVKLLERGFASGVVKEFILVAANYSATSAVAIYGNSSTSGRWLDFTASELVPFIDGRFRTLRHRNSRGLAGDFFGAYGALKLAMTHSDIFSTAYALHPVATGGYLPWPTIQVDWNKIHQAKTFAEIPAGRERIFVAIAQSVLPNPNRPPFYCDFWMELENGEPKYHVANSRKAQAGFHLNETVDQYAENLRSMRGIAIDWARYDETYSHVYSVEAFSRKLDDLGVEHDAEEYRGNPWNKNWTDNGRFYSRVLPFFARHLVFEDKN